MKKIIEMAFRNIKRNKRRTLLAVISVSLAVMLVVLIQGLVEGLVENIIKNSVKNETGHIRITTIEYFKNINSPIINEVITNPEELIEYITSDKYISNQIQLITTRIKFPVLLQYKGKNKTAFCIAGDIEKERELLMFDKCIVDGEYLKKEYFKKNNKRYREVIIGKKLAEILDLKVNNTFSLMLSGADFGIRIPSFFVRGIFSSGLNMLDENVFMINIEDAKYVLRTNGGVHEIFIILKDHKNTQKIREYINNLLSKKDDYKNLIASDWKQTGGWVKMMEQALKIYNFMYLAITFLGTFIIANIMLMIILERKREIGILKSMGFKNSQILLLFTLEGMILGAIGSIFGAILGTLISIPLSIYGLDFSSSMSSMNYPMDNIVKWSINPVGVFSSMILGVFVSLVVSILPSRYATKITPIDALKTL